MPTALTTATAREDLIEQTIFLGAMTAQLPKPPAESVASAQSRLAVLVGRYLNTLRLHPDTGEEEHDELHAVTVALIDGGIALGVNVPNLQAHANGNLRRYFEELGPLTLNYLATMYKLHNLGAATSVLAPAPAPAVPLGFSLLRGK